MADKPEENDIWHKRPQKEGPPDLDELINKLQHKLNSLFRKKPAKSGEVKQHSWKWLWILVGLAPITWLLLGIFVVAPSEQAAVSRFGAYVETVGPGTHWVLPLIESKQTVDLQKISTYPFKAEVLTQDADIVSVEMVVQYRVNDLKAYLFNDINPQESLQQATASVVQQVIGQTTFAAAVTNGRDAMRQQLIQRLNASLAKYNIGLIVTDVTIQSVKPPAAIQDAVDDVNKAREAQQTLISNAKDYQQQSIATAQSKAKLMLIVAKAYKQQVILDAQAKTAGFLALLPQYEKAPAVMRERMYIETMQKILTTVTPIIVDAKTSNLMYLPINKIVKQLQQDESQTPQVAAKSKEQADPVASNDDARPSYDMAGESQ